MKVVIVVGPSRPKTTMTSSVRVGHVSCSGSVDAYMKMKMPVCVQKDLLSTILKDDATVWRLGKGVGSGLPLFPLQESCHCWVEWRRGFAIRRQQAKGVYSTRFTSHARQGANKRLEFPTITITWHADKYKVDQFSPIYTLEFKRADYNFQGDTDGSRHIRPVCIYTIKAIGLVNNIVLWKSRFLL